MPAKPSQLLISTTKPRAVIQILGRANFNLSVDFKKLIYQLIEQGYSHFVFDVRECLLMDSTFVGITAGFTKHLHQALGEKATVELWDPPERVQDMFENLGVIDLFKLSEGESQAQGDFKEVSASKNLSKRKLTETSLEAHETLMKLNGNNVSKFEDVTQFLRRELDNS